MKVNTSNLRKLAERFKDPALRTEISALIGTKGVQAIVAQAIADNFAQDGPGWQPLSSRYMRSEIVRVMKKKKNRDAFFRGEAIRRILQKSGLLKKSVTTPGAPGNVCQVVGLRLVWGTDLVYAGIHNYGGTIHNPGTKNGFGMGIKIPAHDIPIPQREFLVIHEKWKMQLEAFIMKKATAIVKKIISGGG
jgi:phage gpG-like protein